MPTQMPAYPPMPARRAFTLAELLIVIGIIALLVGILVPVIGRVRIAGQTTDTSAMIRAIDSAIQAYQGDHQAWPGPLADSQMGLIAGTPVDSLVPVGGTAGDGFSRPAGNLVGVTGSENLVLGLLGGIVPWDDDNDTNTPSIIAYDPAAIGRGPVKLGGRTPGASRAYFDGGVENLSMHVIGDDDASFAPGGTAGERWGRFVDAGSAAQDSIIPEFVDRYGDPLPILYMRASPSSRVDAAKIGATAGEIIATDDPTAVPGVFHQSQIAGYVNPTGVGIGSIGGGKSPDEPYHENGTRVNPEPSPLYHGLQITPLTPPADDTAPAFLRGSMNKGGTGYTYPYDARAYFLSPSEAKARQQDRYVLISAGPDRVYGTEDDVTNFGSVP